MPTVNQESGLPRTSIMPSRSSFSRLFKRLFLIIVCLLILVWALIPAWRGISLLANNDGRSIPNPPDDFPVESVHFPATDGQKIAGWFAMTSPNAPTVILVHGFKGRRADMLPWARFLVAGGYNVLLYDNRGSGESEGWGITLGVKEPNDVIGAVHYLQQRTDLKNKQFGALGISLGAGIVIEAASQEPALQAIVADSAWTDETPHIDRMGKVWAIPLLPYEAAFVDFLIGGRLADAKPLAMIPNISPRAVFLIHAADDANMTTLLYGEQQLFAAAGQPKQEWIAAKGGHVGAILAYKEEYQRRVLAYFATYLQKTV